MKIVIDSRETKPWKFPLEYVCTIRGLKTGDYSLDGYEDQIVIERKGIGDLVKCLTTDRSRFRKQLARLRKIPYRCVMVETTLFQISRKRYTGYIRPDEVLAGVAALSVEFKTMFQFTDNPELSARMALAFMIEAQKNAQRLEAAGR